MVGIEFAFCTGLHPDEMTDETEEVELTRDVVARLPLEIASGLEQWMLDDVEDAAKSWEQASCKYKRNKN